MVAQWDIIRTKAQRCLAPGSFALQKDRQKGRLFNSLRAHPLVSISKSATAGTLVAHCFLLSTVLLFSFSPFYRRERETGRERTHIYPVSSTPSSSLPQSLPLSTEVNLMANRGWSSAFRLLLRKLALGQRSIIPGRSAHDMSRVDRRARSGSSRVKITDSNLRKLQICLPLQAVSPRSRHASHPFKRETMSRTDYQRARARARTCINWDRARLSLSPTRKSECTYVTSRETAKPGGCFRINSINDRFAVE